MTQIRMFESFLTGHPVIDDGHRMIVDVVNEISEAIHEEDLIKCDNLNERFFEIIKVHFKQEEAVLAELQYPDLENHKEIHQKLLDQVCEMKTACVVDMDKDKICCCFDNLVIFVIVDIVKHDSEFKSFLDENGYHTEELVLV